MAAVMHVAEPVIEETIELPRVAGQHGCVSLVLKRRYRTRNIFRHFGLHYCRRRHHAGQRRAISGATISDFWPRPLPTNANE
jgi:hypothetical protein